MNSQYDEEKHILANTPASGFFLDLGAFHPTALSNTRALIERGWRGRLIDVSPAPIKNLATEYRAHPRVRVVQAAVGIDRRWIELQLTDDAVTTSSTDVHTLWKEKGGYYGSVWAQTVPFTELVSEPIDFLNIDVEGQSAELFIHAIDVLQHLPACICVEHDGRLKDLVVAAVNRGYRQVYANGTNLVLAR